MPMESTIHRASTSAYVIIGPEGGYELYDN